MRICFSAGHGLGSRKPGAVDPGAVGSGIEEADFTRSFSKRLALDFSALGHWVMLRDSGHYAGADDDAARAMCDVFIEIHLNAGPKAANGTETLVHPSAPKGSFDLARRINDGLVRALTTRDRGVKTRADLAVLKPHAGMKACLVEVFFITSKEDFSKWQKNPAAAELAVVNAILVSEGKKPVKSLPRRWGRIRRAIARIV